MIYPLFKRNLISCVKIFVIIFLVICMYTSVIIYMYNPELSEMLSGYQEALPEMMSAMGMTGIATNLLQWIQIYLYGFIMSAFPMIFAIILGNKLVLNYIDCGSMASLLSTPHSRTKIILTQAISGVLFMVLLMAAVTAVGIVSSQLMFPGELAVGRYIQLNISATLLQLCILGITFFVACVTDEAKNYYVFGAGIPILFFLCKMLAGMGDSLKGLKYFTVYSLLPAEKIVDGVQGTAPFHVAMLLIAIGLFAGGILWFRRRDLSL